MMPTLSTLKSKGQHISFFTPRVTIRFHGFPHMYVIICWSTLDITSLEMLVAVANEGIYIHRFSSACLVSIFTLVRSDEDNTKYIKDVLPGIQERSI